MERLVRRLRPGSTEEPVWRDAHIAGAVLLLVVFVVACGGPPSPGQTSSVCGDAPSEAQLLPSDAPTGTDDVEAIYTIVGQHGTMLVEVALQSDGPGSWYAGNWYVETGDWLCVVPQDLALVGEPATVHVAALAEAWAMTSGGDSNYADSMVALSFAGTGPVNMSHSLDETSGGTPFEFDGTLLVPVVLGEWVYLSGTVDIRVGAGEGASGSAKAALAFWVDRVTAQGGSTLAVQTIETASGTEY